MSELKSRWKSVSDREKWAARGVSFVAKVKATKAVWFPSKPVETGKKAASTAEKATKNATKKAARKSTRTAKKATRKSTRAAKKPRSAAPND